MNNFYLNLIKEQEKDQELFCVLEDYFRRPHQFRFDDNGNMRAFVYSNTDGNPVLEVLLTKKGRIDKISSQLSKQETKVLEEQIKHAVLDNNGDKIGQVVCFFTGSVETYYRCDHFQILPVPAHAPKSPMLAHSPFLLQFTYPTSSNWRIEAMRCMEQEQRYINLLTLFLHTVITINPSRPTPTWTRGFEQQNSSELRFPGYFYPDYAHSIDTFSDTSDYQQNASIPAKDYYTGIHAFYNTIIAGQHELRIPDNLCLSFEKVRSLSKKDRENFYHACYWLRQAQIASSRSLSLIALITAIECFIEKKQCPACHQERVVALGRCEVCTEPIYKLTESFKDFVEKWLPVVARDQTALSLLYDTRSSLVHGSAVLLSDSHPWIQFEENKQAYNEYSIYDRAYILTKAVLNGWLHGGQYA